MSGDSSKGTLTLDAVISAAERARVEKALEGTLSDLLAAVPAAVTAPIRYALGAGGKRLRPVLCMAAYRAVQSGGEVPAAAYDLGVALELIHTYSLMHDDLPSMDDDELRRGRPTVHRVYGVAAATAAGAALIPLAFEVLERAGRRLGLAPACRLDLHRELARAAGASGMVGGQVLDLEAEGRALSLGELEAVHRRKTGALFAAALRLGARAAGGSPEAVEALGQVGLALGLAFQITDDVLDETGESVVLGKVAGRDRERAKATFPALLGVTEARRRAAAAAAEALDGLERAGVADVWLTPLIHFAVERDR